MKSESSSSAAQPVKNKQTPQRAALDLTISIKYFRGVMCAAIAEVKRISQYKLHFLWDLWVRQLEWVVLGRKEMSDTRSEWGAYFPL